MKSWRSRRNEIAQRPTSHYAGAEGDALFAQPGASRGGSNASFFLRYGFTVADWQRLAEALIRHASDNEVVEIKETSHGRRYVVDGPLTAPDRTNLNVRTAWYSYPSSDAPRFVTAHPLPKL